MASTFSGLEIGKTGLAAAQIALNITGQNIANADTDGYTRQKVSTSAIAPVGAGYLIRQLTPTSNVGQGVLVVSVNQVRSAYLDEQFRGQYSAFSRSEYITQGLSYLENLFNETKEDTSITASIANLFDALSEFSKDTASEAARTTVQQTALSMAENFNMIYREMIDLYNDQNSSARTVAMQINELSSQIAELNGQIFEYERSGESANELRDARNVLLDKLSGYAAVSYEEESSGMVNISLAGETLVDGQTASKIAITTVSEGINGLCAELASLNQDVLDAGSITPEQEALRDSLLAGLQSVSDSITASVNPDGTVTVDLQYAGDPLAGPVTAELVNGSAFTAATPDMVAEYVGGCDEGVFKLGGTYLNSENVKGGELQAHLSLRDGAEAGDAGIPYYISRLDGLARIMAQTINECMNEGYTYPDTENANVSQNGVDMFEDFGNAYDMITAGNFTLSGAVLQSVWNIAGSSKQIDLSAASGSTNAANNEIALKLSELIGENKYSDELDSIVSHLGIEVYSNKNELSTRQTLVESIENQRKSISGVSIDEEAVNLIKYNQIYSACSRIITTMDEMLDRLINGTGRVGL